MLPEFPIAKQKIRKSQDDFFQFAVKNKMGGLFGNIPRRALPEGNRMKHEYSREMVHETGMTAIKSSFQLDIDQVKANPFLIYEKLLESAEDFANQQMIMTVKGIEDVTTLTGNVVNSGGEFTTEHFFQCIEKVSVDFDEYGNPNLPTIVGGPEVINKMIAVLKESEHLPENKKRIDRIMEQKRKEWYDRENNRKLVD